MKPNRTFYNEIDKSYNVKEGVVKFNANNTDDHEISKAIVCLEILKNGGNFCTEVVWKNKSRSDIVDLSDEEPLIIEIVHTEKIDGHKEKQYPFKIIYLKTNKIINNWKNTK